MFKTIVTLFRGAANETAQNFTDQHALVILRQQINDSSRAVQSARKAVAVAIAQNKREETQLNKIEVKLADIESRTMIALEQDKEEAARDGAEAIAILEEERKSAKQAIAGFSKEITRLKAQVRTAESRLRELKRGEHLANASDKTQKMRAVEGVSAEATISEAEDTLLRLRMRQQQIDATNDAISEMELEGDAQTAIEKLAAAGCGKPLKTSTDMVLERLRNSKQKPGTKPATTNNQPAKKA